MKKSLLVLATLTAFAGVASAQSSVTLFGIVDLSANAVKNGSRSQKLMGSDQLNSNRLGFRGIEDLGGGMRAGFWLEAGMSPDNGAAGGGNGTATNSSIGANQTSAANVALFNRRATVSLMGGFGEIRLGRDYVATFSNRASFDPFGFNGMGNMGNVESMLGSRANTQVRANNVIAYFLPAMGGVYGQLQVAAGEGAAPGLNAAGASDGNTANKYVGGRIGYAGGPVNVGASWGKTSKSGVMVDDFTQANIGASFNLGFMTLMGMYDKVDYSTLSQKKLLLGLTVPFGASTLKASYNKATGSVGFEAAQFALGYQYDLSKRTALYATVASLNNDGTTATGGRATIGQGPAMTQGGDTSRGYNVGVRHSF